ncbi:hypothetical protein PG984_005067 [Apiospora sp. TS-2023a]
MEPSSDPSSLQSSVHGAQDKSTSGTNTDAPMLPTTHDAHLFEALDKRFRAIDYKITVLNNLFNLQNVTRPEGSKDDPNESDGSEEPLEPDGDQVMRQTIKIMEQLTACHNEYQQTRRRRAKERRNAKPTTNHNPQTEVEEESAREISTKSYLENNSTSIGLLDWPGFVTPRWNSIKVSVHYAFYVVIGDLDAQIMDQLHPNRSQRPIPTVQDYSARMILAEDPAESVGPARIKISSALVAVFAKVGPSFFWQSTHNRDFMLLHPFKELVQDEEKLREHLSALEEHFDGLKRTGALSVKGKRVPRGDERLADSVTALLHLRCLIKFFDNEVKPKVEYFASNDCRKIRFRDLWYLYKTGDEVIDQPAKQVYRIMRVESPRHMGMDLSNRPLDWHQKAEAERRSIFKVHCSYVAFNGKEFGPVSVTFNISPFAGLRDIDSLPIYPLRLDNDPDLRGKLIARGKMLLILATLEPMYYTGPSLNSGEDIDSQVIVDVKEALVDEKRNAWAPIIAHIAPGFEQSQAACSDPCCRWLMTSQEHRIDEDLSRSFIQSLVSKTPFQKSSLVIAPRLLEEILPGTENGPNDDEFLVMTYRAFGFVLRTRKWAQLDLTYLRHENKEVRDSTLGAFDRLELPDGHREMVKSLVTQHFRDKRAAGTRDNPTDIIRGKGKGLIMLLHGAPGVGKTTTAEGVAELFHKPLFHITCGDLGTTARDVEAELEKNFALASRWGCILLLDEADVFLSARERKDFERNGLVAVFLRMLEYYTGILFLTTNRIGDFDEAFASRIHMSLYYPELDELKTKKVFKLNLDLIQERFGRQGRKITYDVSSIEDFAEQHYRKHVYSRWNGRQIRNACQTALALAEYDAHGGQIAQDDVDDDSDVVVALQLRHFLLVQTAYLDFGRYLGDIRGTQGDRRAIDYGLRAKTQTPYQNPEPSHSSPVFYASGLNANSYLPTHLPTGYTSSYDSQYFPHQGSHVVDPAHHSVNRGEASGSGGAYAVSNSSSMGPSIYRQSGQSPSQNQGPGSMYSTQGNPQNQTHSYSATQPGQMEPRLYQGPNPPQGSAHVWGNAAPVPIHGYPPASGLQQGQVQVSNPQWQNLEGQQQHHQRQPLYRFSNVQNGGGGGGLHIPSSSTNFVAQTQASYGGQGGAPGNADA